MSALRILLRETTLGKIACVFVAAALLCGTMLLSGCAESEPVSLLIKVPRTKHSVIFDDSITQADQAITRMVEQFERDYGKPVNIEVEIFEQTQYDEAIDKTFGTDDAPDILYGDYFNMFPYVYSDHAVPLDDLVTDDVHSDVFSYLWDASTVDGHVYLMPYLARQNVMAYNKELFRQAGLEEYIQDGVIQSWTLDEWTHILDTLAQNLPEGSYPMMMYANSSQGDTHIMTLLRAAGSTFLDENGHFNLSTSEGIAALRWIQEGVERGWYPPYSENLEVDDCVSLFQADQLGICVVNNATLERYGADVGLANFPSSDENGCATSFISGFEVFDNGDPEKMQVAKDFISYVYDHDELLDYSAGTLPASRSVAERYGDQILMFDEFIANRANVIDFFGDNPGTPGVREVFHQLIRKLLTGASTPEAVAATLDKQCNIIIDEARAASDLHE